MRYYWIIFSLIVGIQSQAPSNDYKSTVLYHHNVHRANHSSPALEWDDVLAQYAANTGHRCVFEHDMGQGNGNYGQNLAAFGATNDIGEPDLKFTAEAITNNWYNSEAGNWKFYGGNPPDGSNINDWGHFTQVIWKSTTKVGCASVLCPRGTMYERFNAWFAVCNYSPPGNSGGQYATNILQPLGYPAISV